MNLLAPYKSAVFKISPGAGLSCYSPSIMAMPDGRLISSFDIAGDDMASVEGPKGLRYGRLIQMRVCISDDRGANWRQVAAMPMMHARVFSAGKSVYVLGHCGDLMIARSDDRGETWTEPARLTNGCDWHQAPCNVWNARGNVYLVMERRPPHDVKAWAVSVIAPVLMRACEDADLMRRESWTFASELVFREAVRLQDSEYFGVPFYNVPRTEEADGCAPFGWLETNVVQITDPNHIWFDPEFKTFYLFSRAHLARTGYCAISRVVENDDGSMTTQLVRAPSGKIWLYLPMPGGQMKFHILWDQLSRTYWLLSTQATDSTIRPERLKLTGRYGLPDNERRRLQLHFSKNCVDWCFAGMVDIGEAENASRHYASMCISGDDILVLSRSGDSCAKNPHDGNIISFHEVKNFRSLIY